jgi:hypothetical protein
MRNKLMFKPVSGEDVRRAFHAYGRALLLKVAAVYCLAMARFSRSSGVTK